MPPPQQPQTYRCIRPAGVNFIQQPLQRPTPTVYNNIAPTIRFTPPVPLTNITLVPPTLPTLPPPIQGAGASVSHIQLVEPKPSMSSGSTLVNGLKRHRVDDGLQSQAKKATPPSNDDDDCQTPEIVLVVPPVRETQADLPIIHSVQGGVVDGPQQSPQTNAR